jgi:hypothetical protein
MAVTISEMHVEVQDSQTPAAAPNSAEEPKKKDLTLSQALEVLRERSVRLQAD